MAQRLLLFGAFGAIALLASVSFDRLSPALGMSLAIVLVSYFLEVLGSLWPDAKGLQPYSLFHYLDPKAILAGSPTRRLRGPGGRHRRGRRGGARRLPAPRPRRAELTRVDPDVRRSYSPADRQASRSFIRPPIWSTAPA